MDQFFASLHPALVSFPFVTVWLIVILEVVSFKGDEFGKVSTGIFALTAITTLFSYLTGHEASEFASQTFSVPDSAIGTHFLWAKISLFTVIPCFGLKLVSLFSKHKQEMWRNVYLLTLLASAFLLTYTGWLGGRLVFEYGAGVAAKI